MRAPLGELAARYAEERPLGEVTLVVAGAPEPAEGLELPEGGADLRTRAQRLLAAGYSVRDVADILTAETATPRKPLYDLALSLKGEQASSLEPTLDVGQHGARCGRPRRASGGRGCRTRRRPSGRR